jgi:hypothetical protein
MTRLDAISSRVASNFLEDWIRMPEAQRDYFRRMVRRVERAIEEVDAKAEVKGRAA